MIVLLCRLIYPFTWLSYDRRGTIVKGDDTVTMWMGKSYDTMAHQRQFGPHY